MLISKDNRKAIYQYLFQEGVLVAKKDYNLAKHPEIDVRNLEVIKALQSLNSRGFVKTQFSWQYYYYSLTNEGIEYLRSYLHLPAEIVPRTFLKVAKPVGSRPQRDGERGPRDFKSRGEGEYRRRDDGEKKSAAGGNWKPEFRAGVGRGAPKPAPQ
ncbi:40S ribosomal protein S10-like protein [Globomyces pollinis-pini]|nr:40S ribosomal protein S10-like protein [Globomyces pollinis-pini]